MESRKAEEAGRAIEQLRDLAERVDVAVLLGYRQADRERRPFRWNGPDLEEELLQEVEAFREHHDANLYGVLGWKVRYSTLGHALEFTVELFRGLPGGPLREHAERTLEAVRSEWQARIRQALDSTLERIRRDPFPTE